VASLEPDFESLSDADLAALIDWTWIVSKPADVAEFAVCTAARSVHTPPRQMDWSRPLVAAPQTLLTVDKDIKAACAKSLLLKMPRAKAETSTRIANHLQAALDLTLLSGHREPPTSHIACWPRV